MSLTHGEPPANCMHTADEVALFTPGCMVPGPDCVEQRAHDHFDGRWSAMADPTTRREAMPMWPLPMWREWLAMSGANLAPRMAPRNF